MQPQSIPVICDRCRAQGLAGEDPFAAFGALLDFDPVPRRTHRADGWDAEVQRAFIAALSLTGSERAACRAVGKSAYGVTQLLAHDGADGFRAAYDEAMAMAADERRRRLAEGLRSVAAEQSGWRPPEQPWSRTQSRSAPASGRGAGRGGHGRRPPDEEEEDTLEAREAWIAGIFQKYFIKVGQEREERLAGRIVAADYYLRQMTWMEVALDLLSGDGFEALRDFRKDDHPLMHIAETPMSKMLGEVRRMKWAELGEPPRPDHPPRHLLEHHDGYSTEPTEATYGGRPLSHDEQRRIFEERHARDALAQIEWEAEARRDYERRRASDAANNQESRPAGQPREERTDVTDSLRDGPAEACPEQSRRARRDYERRRAASPLMDGEPGSAGQPAPEGDRTDVTNLLRHGDSAHQPAPQGDSTDPESPAEEP
ncbi:MAG TPA: hypothetical protein VF582_05150 [Allosphingosinicella sp.]|jgi:hypothetical protein